MSLPRFGSVTEIIDRPEMKSESGKVDDKTSENTLNRFDNYPISSLPSIPKMKLLLRRFRTTECPCVDHFWTVCTDNDGLCFSLKKNYCFTRHSKSILVGSCNGILCLDDICNNGNTVLWNPVTDELKSLPASSIKPPPGYDSARFYAGGFVFDAISEDYKVLRHVDYYFAYDDGTFKSVLTQAELYSLKNDSWRPIDKPKEYWWSFDSLPISLNGSCYWKSLDCVVSFNFADEVYSSFPLTGTKIGQHHLCDMDGKLGSFVITRKKSVEPVVVVVDIWVWESNESCWSKVDSFVVVEKYLWPLGFWGRDKCILKRLNGQLLVFDLRTRELMSLDMNEFSGTQYLVSFEESTDSFSKIAARNKQPGSIKEGSSSGIICKASCKARNKQPGRSRKAALQE